MFRPYLLSGLLLLTGVAAAHAQRQDPATDCAYNCYPESLCTMSCTDGGGESNCGNYGVCNPDPDADNLPYYLDNCPVDYNPNQADCDGDGVGDVCDSQDATYVVVEARNCWIRNRVHAWGSDTTWYSEVRYHDTSSCGSPDWWAKLTEDKRDCVGTYDSYDCCTSKWSTQNCYLYGVRTCHF
jgi:hypothetical protein